MAGKNGAGVIEEGEDLEIFNNPKPGEGRDREERDEPKPKEKEAPKSKDEGEGDHVKLTKKEHAALLKRIEEGDESGQYWKNELDKVRRGGKEAPKEDDDEDDFKIDPELEDPDKLVDALAKQGIGALKRAGYLNAKEVKALIAKHAGKIADKTSREVANKSNALLRADMKLIQQFPGLADEDSDFTAATLRHMKDLLKDDPEIGKSPAAIRLAAKLAKAELDGKAKDKDKNDEDEPKPKRGKADDDDDAEARYRRQAPERGDRSRKAADEDEGDSELSPLQRQFAAKMGVTDDEFKTQRKEMGNRSKR